MPESAGRPNDDSPPWKATRMADISHLKGSMTCVMKSIESPVRRLLPSYCGSGKQESPLDP
jgi:hypothetical protein